MANEIEAKARVERLDAIRERLVELGARLAESGFEHNIVFDTPDGKLRAKDSLLRLRRCGVNLLTFKGPRAGISPIKSRREIEFEVSDFDATVELLESLGFERSWVYEKRREKWRLEGAKIFLDVLPRLGEFVEVEADSPAAVSAMMARLGIAESSVTPKTYLELFREFAGGAGADAAEMVFEKGEGA